MTQYRFENLKFEAYREPVSRSSVSTNPTIKSNSSNYRKSSIDFLGNVTLEYIADFIKNSKPKASIKKFDALDFKFV